MPITLSAKKKVRQDKKREQANLKTKEALSLALKKASKNPSLPNLKTAFSAIDRAAKKKVIHKNRAARLKSRLAKKRKK